MPAASFTAGRVATTAVGSRVATTVVSTSAGHAAAHSGHFAPTGGSNINTLDEARLGGVRTGRRIGGARPKLA